jgi:hypothetical protein
MFLPHIVAIFREVFFEGILHMTLKKYTNIKRYVLGTRYVFGLHVSQLYKILSVAQQLFYGEYMRPATMKRT